jgi:ankyrin repeat protein
MASGASASSSFPGGGPRLLPHAAKDGDAQLVARLLAEGRDVNEADEAGRTALHWAVSLGRADVVRLLLASKSVEVNKTTPDGPVGGVSTFLAEMRQAAGTRR